jgi:hypothetical protein
MGVVRYRIRRRSQGVTFGPPCNNLASLVAGPQLIHHAVDLLLLVVESGRRCRPPAKPGSHGDGRRLGLDRNLAKC